MKESGIMKVYYLTKKISEGLVKQEVIYIPERAVIEQNPQKKSEFFYITDRKIMEEMRSIVDKKNIKAIEADVDEVYNLLKIGVNKEKISKEFSSKAESLFEWVGDLSILRGKRGGGSSASCG